MKYLLCDHWGGEPFDVKKTVDSAEDDLMCWAAAASNVLAWTRWGFPPARNFDDVISIFNYFQDHWIDAVGYPSQAWEWWFAGSDFDKVDVPGGGFWKDSDYSFNQYYHVENNRANALTALDQFLHTGQGVVLSLVGQNGGHEITCWGYEQDDDGDYVGIYTTDSDDPSQGLRYYEINQDISGDQEWAHYKDWWYFTYHNGSTRYLIGAVHALGRFPDEVVLPSNLTLVD